MRVSHGFAFRAVSRDVAVAGQGHRGAQKDRHDEADSYGDNFVNLMVGLEKTVGSQVSFILEYNFALNDNNGDFGGGKGYLNAGLRWSVGSGFTLEFDLRDLLQNSSINSSSADRALKIEYIQTIF